MKKKIQSKPFGGLGIAWTRLNDYDKARWKLTGMYILVFFVLLNLFTGSLFFILKKAEIDYEKHTNIIWQKKQVFFSRDNVVVLEWNNNSDNVLNKQDILQLQQEFLSDIRYWIIVIEIILLVLVGFVSYWLSGKTLKPIKIKSELQKQFLADVSHELKNPLSALKVSLDVAKEQKNWSGGEVREMISDLQEEVERLDKITKDLLVLENVNIQSKKKKYSLKNIISDQVTLLQPLAKKRNIEIKSDLKDCMHIVNKKSVEQVVFNFLHNAIKFSNPNSIVEISLSQEGIMKIRDFGIGIDEKDLPYIFDRFYKADNSRTFNQDNGSGLGLAIVKKIVDKNNWKISIKSQKTKGTIVEIIF